MGCQLVSLLLAILISLLVVVFIYIFSWKQHRDQPEAITRRFIGIAFATVISLGILNATGFIQASDIKPSLDFTPSHLTETIVIPLVITFILFLGPIINKYKEGSLFDPETNDFHIFLRNFVLGPIMEEVIYRFILVTLLFQCYSKTSTVLISSVLFSLSHGHHHINALIPFGEWEDWCVFLSHLIVTFVFASYACIFYLRVNCIITPILIHSFCNLMKSPDFEELMSKGYLKLATFGGFIVSVILLIVFVSS